MSNFYLVFGPERSGTRMLTSALISCGVQGEASHEQKYWDVGKQKVNWHLINPSKNTVVVRQSVPHNSNYTDLPKIVEEAEEYGFKVICLMIFRSIEGTAKSRLAWNDKDRHKHVMKQRSYIFEMLSEEDIKPYIINYEVFCEVPEYRKWVFNNICKLDEPKGKYKNANIKYGFTYKD